MSTACACSDNFFLRGEIELRTIVLKDFCTFEVRTADIVFENVSKNSHVRMVCTQTLSTTSASSAVSTLAHALGVRLAMIDGVGDRARVFVRAMIALRASHQEIATALQISEAALVAEFAAEIE